MRILSEEHKRKISEALKGRKHGSMPDTVRSKISSTLKGKPHSTQHNQRVSKALIGKKRASFSEEWKKKIGEASKKRWLEGKFDNRDISFHNIEWRENHSKQMKGLNNPNWQGGINPIYATIRNSNEYKNWRKQVFERDNYTCQDCGKPSNGNIEAHHIKPFSQILDEFNIKSF
ncbi:HNH endonuclease, partial [Candidatus Bathyarchaeota archaeon]|nr:HNH endonuclease [Candidatus Bathyarchaeota archaeon]